MKINELVQTDTKTVTDRQPILDADGMETGEYETITREVPVMRMVYRDMTPEEEAEALAQQAAAEEYERTRPRTVEEKLEETKQDVDMLADTVLVLCDILEGGDV